MQLPGLDVPQSRAFVFEVNATKNTLACGLRLLSTDALTENTRDPIMVLLSVGLERLHKLTLGVISVADSGHWDDSKAHRHRLSMMHHDVLEAISHRVTSPYVEELLRARRSDRLLDAVIACADSFAREGRYSYLDALSAVSNARLIPIQRGASSKMLQSSVPTSRRAGNWPSKHPLTMPSGMPPALPAAPRSAKA